MGGRRGGRRGEGRGGRRGGRRGGGMGDFSIFSLKIEKSNYTIKRYTVGPVLIA